MNPHWYFVIAAYAITLFAIGAMTLWLLADHRGLKKKLAGMEAADERRQGRAS